MTIETPATVRRYLFATAEMITEHLTSGEPVPIGLELGCINLARRVHQACIPQRDLLWLVQLPSRTTLALLFLVQEAIRQLDACRPQLGSSRGEPKLRTPLLRKRHLST